MAGGSWRSDPLDAWLLHLDARLCNVLRMPQSEPSLKEGLSNCSELPAGNSAASLRLMKTIWKVFAMQGCRRTDSGVGAWGQTANVWTGAVGWGCGELSWAGSTPERKEPETGCTYSRAVSITVHLPATGWGKPVFYSHKKLSGPCIRLRID